MTNVKAIVNHLQINRFVKKSIKKYSYLSTPVKASLWFTVCSFMQKGIILLTTPIFTRLLTTEQFGTYSIYQSWINVILILATLKLSTGVFNNGMVRYREDRSLFISSLQGLTSLTTCALLILYFVDVGFWNRLLGLNTFCVVTMFLEIFFSSAFLLWSAGQRYVYRYKTLVALTLVMSAGTIVLGIAFVVSTNYKAEARIISYAVIQICVGLVLYIHNIKKGKKLFVPRYWKYALRFNLPLIPHYLSLMVLQQADRIMIAQMAGKGQAAVYAVAYNISTLMSLVVTAINSSLIPYIYEKLNAHNYADLKKAANALLTIVGCGCVFVMAFGPEIVKIFATAAYYEAVWIIPPVSLSVYFMFLYPLFGNVELYFEARSMMLIASCLGAALNIILNYLLIPIFGYLVAGYTTLFCYFVFAVLHYLAYKSVLKKNSSVRSLFDMRFILLFSLVMTVSMLIMLLLYKMILIRYFTVVILFVIFIFNRKKIMASIMEIKKT